ncbi:tripartite tricarboxylate transporter TctB family protein [Massilia sp. MS-15]|uniref:tripartite tricarboxylate transporter TctB family protein n=1 Tax=Massilia sp. MS-15 TaxID=2878200 RepID=UPI001CD22886|nr:tripartite tricarboxylate transporter TctB family protein [Massilia sp. MS-15]
MASTIRHPKNFWIGIIFVIFGLAAVYFGRELGMGTAGRMGPGYFPTVLGWLLAFVGLLGIVRAFVGRRSEAHDAISSFHLRDIAIILGAVLLFGVLVRGAGLALSAFVLVMLSAYASRKFRLGSTVLLAVGLSLFAVVLFVKLLGLPMPIAGPWLTGD